MATFVDAFGNVAIGYPLVNLDHVRTLRPIRAATDAPASSTAYDCLDANGDRIATIAAYQIDDEPRGVVAETRGTTMIVFWDGGESRYPVLAWSIRGRCATPISCELFDANEVYCIEVQEPGHLTRWLFVEDCEFTEWEQARLHGHEQRRKYDELRQRRRSAGEGAPIKA